MRKWLRTGVRLIFSSLVPMPVFGGFLFSDADFTRPTPGSVSGKTRRFACISVGWIQI
jgi:hypothetical protein